MASPTKQVFVSSTWEDLQPERDAMQDVAQRMRDVKFVGMEYFGSRDETTLRASLEEVDRSDLYLGIFAGRYGSGITEAEYRRAQEKKLPCLIYFKAESEIRLNQAEKEQAQRESLDKLKAELRLAHTVTEFDSPADFAAKVTADLYRQPDWDRPPNGHTISALYQLPSPPHDFTGRQEELDVFMRALESGGVTISGLQGSGGVGKTTLALKLAQRLTPRYPDAQLYLDLKGTSKTPLSAADAMAQVIHAYKPTAVLPKDETELGKLYRATLHGRRALLLMDNAANRNQVEPLIPPESCVMLVTSRQRFVLPGLFSRNLNTMSARDARELLLKISPRIGAQADTIAKLCGYLPLALRLAASALAERVDLTVASYVKSLKSAQNKLKLINASLSLSYELLAAAMQEHWRTLAVFPNTFDSAAASAVLGIEADAAQDALSELVKYNLLEWDEATARYRLHDLARLFAGARLSEAERDKGQRRHASHYLNVLGGAQDLYLRGGEAVKRGLVLFDLEWPNIQAGQRWAEEHTGGDDEAASLCSNYPSTGLALFALRQRPRERIRWRKKALAAALRLKARDQEGWHLSNLGIANYELGKLDRAIEFHMQHLNITRETGDLLGKSQALNNLGAAYTAQGNAPQAIKLHEQALFILRHKIHDRRCEGHTLSHLGAAYASLGKAQSNPGQIRRGIKFYEQYLDIAREIGDRRGEGQTLNNLGVAYADLGNLSRAVEMYEQRLAIARELGDRRGEGTVFWNMSRALYKLGQSEKALTYAEKALEIFKQLEHPNVAWVRMQLAAWRRQQKARSGPKKSRTG